MVVYRILPALTSEFVNLDMVPFVLPNVLLIAEECTKEEYVRLILPDLTPVFKQQEPVQVDTCKHRNEHKYDDDFLFELFAWCFSLLTFVHFELGG